MTEAGHDPGAAYREVRATVLGASGFMGRWVARALVARGARVALVTRDRRRAAGIFDSLGIAGDVAEVDLRDAAAVRGLFRAIRPAITFNLVGYGVDPAERDEATAELINGRLVGWIAEAAAEWRDAGWSGAAMVHTGSALEYGQIGGGLAEDAEPRPTTTYGRSKLAGTRLLAEAAARRALPAVTARLFMVYGPGERPGRLLPSLLDAARTGRPLALTEGTQRRDFTYVEDVAEGLLRLGTVAGRPGHVVNLATGKLSTVRAFTELAGDILGMPREHLGFGQLPSRVGEMSHADVTVTRLRALTGWVPSTGVAEGIRRTRDFVRAHGEGGTPRE